MQCWIAGSRVANITDFSVEVRNSENDPYFSRFLHEVLKFSDFLRILKFFGFNVNTFFKWIPTSKSRATYDLNTDLDTRHRHHNAQNSWSSGEPPLPRYACSYHRYIEE